MEEKEVVKVVLKKQWYKKDGAVKCGYTPVIQAIGVSIPVKVILKRDFYNLQKLADKGTIAIEEVNTKDNPKDLDKKSN